MTHEDLVLATLYTKSGPPSVEKEIMKDLDRVIAAGNQLTEHEKQASSLDIVRRLVASDRPRWREIGQLMIDRGEMKDEETDNE